MNPLRWLTIAARVLWAETFGSRQVDPWTPERKRQAVKNALRARERGQG